MLKSKAVIGLGFGDEGKGITTSHLCKEGKKIVVRFSGGQQAGHTVYINGVSHIFSNFGSGTLQNVPTYWSKFCTFDPIGAVNEWNIICEKIKPEDKIYLYIDKDSPITTPYEKYLNKSSKSIKDGTCGLGVGNTWERQSNNYNITAKDLLHIKTLKIKMDLLKQFYDLGEELDLYKFYESIEFIVNSKYFDFCDSDFINNIPSEEIIFEGSQGILLDQDIGFYPYVARTNTGTKNIQQLTKNNFDVYAVTRSYQTRHGNGPMTNLDIPHNISENPLETNKLNEYQGEFKKSLLDIDLLIYSIKMDNYINKYSSLPFKKDDDPNIYLIITCMDHIENEWRFTYKNEIIYNSNKIDFVDKINEILLENNIFLKNIFTTESSETDRVVYSI